MNRNKPLIAVKLVSTVILLSCFLFTKAQNCFEIKSILVDACGVPEGENEMLRFDIGGAALQTANLSVLWANTGLNFKGICQDAATAAKVDTLNQSITGCGYLVEPIAGVLPAFSKVILITSDNFSTVFNSFANLNDTLVIMFQCLGSINGHFANYNSTPGDRTLVMEFTNPAGCIDSVTYDRSLLVNQNGTIGGGTVSNDGSFVEFTTSGVPNYLNNGCNALTTTLSINAGADLIVCSSATINFSATVTGTYVSSLWSGGNGSFSNPTELLSSYVMSLADTGHVDFIFSVTGLCGVTSIDTVHAYFPLSNPAPILTAMDTTLTCSLVSPNYAYSWTLNGIPLIGNSYTQPTLGQGCYQVLVTDSFGCSVLSDSICLTFAGINSQKESFNTSLLPNPSAGMQHLTLETLSNIKSLELQLLSVSGKVALNKTFEVNSKHFETNLDLTTLAKGVYFLKLTTEKKFSVLKVVKE